MDKDSEEMKLSALATRTGTPARTIRLYISMGLLPGPLRAGRNAAYGAAHVERLEQIRALQLEGLTLTQVRDMLDGGPETALLPSSSPWYLYAPAPDVQVMIREDVPPWRARALRLALQQFTRLAVLAEETAEEQDHE